MSLIVLQTVSPDYRQVVWRALQERADGAVLIVAGDEGFAPSIVTRQSESAPYRRVRNYFLFGRRLLIQRIPLRLMSGTPAVIAELNPRILSTWILLIARRARKRRTVLWGHALSTGRSPVSRGVRAAMRSLGDAILVYTDTERSALAKEMPRKPIIVAPNALAAKAEMTPPARSSDARNFIFVGRLVPEKQPDLLIESYLSALTMLPASSRLLMVGDGPLRERLERRVTEADARHRILFLGHVNDLGELRKLYSTSIASVSPGYVGLSIIQSLGFGVPMIIADDEPHSPEIEAADPQSNCVFFRASSAISLTEALVAVDRAAKCWLERSGEIAAACRSRYSAEVMADRMLAAAMKVG